MNEYEASNRGISKRKSFRLPSFARGTNHPKATASDLPEDQVWSAGVAWSEGHKQQRLTRSPSSSAAPSRALPTPTARAAATDDGSSMTAPISPNSRRRASIAVFQLTHPTVSPSAFPRPPAILSCSKSISSSSACSSSGSTTTATASTRRSSRRSVVAAGAGHALSRSSSQASASSVSTASTKHLPDFDALLAGGETIRVSLTPHKYERVMLEDGGEAEEEDGVIKEEDEEVVVVGEEEVEVGEGKGTLERGESWRRW
ncbi:hypothetical protein HK101_008780 [Irineochytrium annulatum]|nr:hypothetical protein HK101_008780 [Irineochytrium annulatum]